MTEAQRTAAMAAGRHAARIGQPATACPYNPGGDPTQKALAGVWVREYVRNSATAAGAINHESM